MTELDSKQLMPRSALCWSAPRLHSDAIRAEEIDRKERASCRVGWQLLDQREICREMGLEEEQSLFSLSSQTDFAPPDDKLIA